MPKIDDPRGLINALRAFADLKERKGEPEYQTELIRNAAIAIEERLDDESVTKDADDTLFVVAIGNAFDGLAVWGPFPNQQDAVDFGEASDDDYTVVDLESPEES